MYFIQDLHTVIKEPTVGYQSTGKVEQWNDIYWLQQLQREGILVTLFFKLKEIFRMTNDDFTKNLSVTWKSISSKNKSEKIHGPSAFLAIDLMALWDEGQEFFKSSNKLQSWLHTKSPFLDGQSPFQMLDTPAGIRRIRDMIGRLKYGITA